MPTISSSDCCYIGIVHSLPRKSAFKSFFFFILVFFLQEDAQLYGVDWNGPIADDEEADSVNVPTIDCPLSDAEYEELCSTVSPLSSSSNYGIDLYIRTLSFFEHLL